MNLLFSIQLTVLLAIYIRAQDSVDIKPVQVNRIYLRNEDQSFFTNNTIYYNSIEQMYYPSRKSCNNSFNEYIKNNREFIGEVNKETVCTPQNFNQTNLLRKCRINVDSVLTTLECHNKIFFIHNKDIANRLREVKFPTNSTISNTNLTEYYKLRITDFVSVPQRVIKVSQNEHQTCFITPTFLQCVHLRDDGTAKLREPLFLMDDQIKHLSKQKNNHTNNVVDQNSTSSDSTSQASPDEQKVTQIKEPQYKRTIIAFSQLSYQNNKSIILIIPSFKQEEELHFITMHTEKYFYDFACQQSIIKFSPKEINFEMQNNTILDIEMTLNEQRGTVNAFLVTKNGIWIFEIQVDFNESADMKFVQKIEAQVDIFSINRNIISVFNIASKKLTVYRMLEYSYDIQTILAKDNVIEFFNDPVNSTPSTEEIYNEFNQKQQQSNEEELNEFILRVFANKKESKINNHRPNQYMIYLINSKTKRQTVIVIQEFSKAQNYLTPLYHILQTNEKVNIKYRVNEEDFKNYTLAMDQIEYTKINRNEKSEEIIIDLKLIKNKFFKNHLIYSTNHAIYVEPICFPNYQLNQSLDGGILTSYSYNGCSPCEISTYSSNKNSLECLVIKESLNNNVEMKHDYSIFEIINNQDKCESLQQKGPFCQACPDYQTTFLPNEQNIKLNDLTAYQLFNQTICPYNCEEKTSRLIAVKGKVVKENMYDELNKRILNLQVKDDSISNNLQHNNLIEIDSDKDNAYQQNINHSSSQQKYFQRKLTESNNTQEDTNQQNENKNSTTTTEGGIKKNNDKQNSTEKGNQEKNIEENKEMKNMDTECVSKINEQEYLNFCSKFKDCYSCSHHPFCIYNPIDRKCQILKSFKNPSNLNFSEFSLNHANDHRTLKEYQKYESCNLIKTQKVCSFSFNVTRYRGEFQFYKTKNTKQAKQPSESKDGIEVIIEEADYSEYEQVEQYQVCSWSVNTERTYSDFDYEVKINLDEGFVLGKDSLQAMIGICHHDQAESGDEISLDDCKLTKMPVSLNQAMTKWIKFGGGKFRFILQFQEKAYINSSKISITYMPVTNHEKQIIIVFCILFIISIFFLLIIVLIFKNKILYCIRVRFNTLYFLDWEDNTEINNITIKQIIRKLEKKKLLKLKTMSSYNSDNYYQHTECSICLVEFEQTDHLYVLVCSHIFHQHCLEEWVKVQYNPVTCPNCKIPLNEAAFVQIEMQKQQQQLSQLNNSLNNNQSFNINKESSASASNSQLIQIANNSDLIEGQEQDTLINLESTIIN